MRVIVIGLVVMVAGVLLIRRAFDHAPYAQYCRVVAHSPDDRFQVEAWMPWDPWTEIDPFAYANCSGRGWLVLRDRTTAKRIGEAETPQLWATDEERVHWWPRAVGIDLADHAVTFQLPVELAKDAEPFQPAQ